MWRTYSLFRRATASSIFSRKGRPVWPLVWGLVLCVTADVARAQNADVSVRLEIDAAPRRAPAAEGAVWLVRQGTAPLREDLDALAQQPKSYQIVQKGKEFHPHLLVVPVGSSIEFPNADPFFHNVFSLFEGKRFDLGLYEAGSRRSVRFDREGISYLFCNIHPEMGAVIISLRTPYYAMLGPDRAAVIRNVPEGEYLLRVWSEDSTEESLRAAERKIEVKTGKVETFSVHATARATNAPAHKNKFGEDYPSQSKQTY